MFTKNYWQSFMSARQQNGFLGGKPHYPKPVRMFLWDKPLLYEEKQQFGNVVLIRKFVLVVDDE